MFLEDIRYKQTKPILTYELTIHEESEMYTQPSLIAALTREVGSRDT